MSQSHTGRQATRRTSARITPPTVENVGVEPLERRRLLDVGLIGHWKFNEASGNIAEDATGRSDGSLQNMEAADRVTGKDGGALWFDGLNERVEVPHDSAYDASKFTVSAWINPDNLTTNAGIVTKGKDSRAWNVALGSGGKLRLVANGGSNWQQFESDTAITPGVWTHVAVTYSGSTVSLYLDGVLDKTHTATLNYTNNTQPLVIGADLPGSDEHFDGRIDSVRLYNRALPATEITALASEPGTPGSFRLATSQITRGEANTFVNVPVIRVAGTQGAATVQYTITEFTATEGEDYTGTSGTVSFADGDTRKNIRVPLIGDSVYEGDETFGVALEVLTGPGTLDAPRTATITIADDETAPPDVGTGLTGSYYRNDDFSDLAFQRVDPRVDFLWREYTPDSRLPADNFSVRWTGQIKAEAAGDYTFFAEADDGVRLWIDGELLIDQPDWTDAAEYVTPTVRLAAGQKVDVRMDFVERAGWAKARLKWDGPGFSKQAIPAANLFADGDGGTVQPGNGDGLRGLYYRNRDFSELAFERVDSTVDFSWENGGPGGGIGSDNFSVRWIGQVQPQHSETYEFILRADDGVRLKVNGQLLVDEPNWTPAPEYVGVISLQAGQKYDLELEFNEGSGWAGAQLLWRSASTPQQVIPKSQLFSVDRPADENGDGTGLLGEYFTLDADDNPLKVFDRIDPRLDFEWEAGGPGGGVGTDDFRVVWRGEIEARYSELYTIHAVADDAVTVIIDGQTVIDVAEWSPTPEYTGTVALERGQRVPIEVRFTERTGWATHKLSWSSASQLKQVVPASQLYPTNDPGVIESVVRPTDDVDNDPKTGPDAGVLYTGESGQTKAYFRFDVRRFNDVEDAKLRVFVDTAVATDTSFRLAYAIDDAWDETTPPPVELSGNVASATRGGSGWIEFDVRAIVRDQAVNDGVVTFVVTSPSNERIALASNENGNTSRRPRLVIDNRTDTGIAPGTGTGLLGEYFDNDDFTRRVATRVDPTLDFDFEDDGPLPGVAADTYSVRWTGQVEARHSETFTFRTESDDGARVWVNGNLIINNFNVGTDAANGSISLVAGQKYDIRVEYFENEGNARMRLLWSSPSTPLQVVPASQLYPADEPAAPTNGSFDASVIVKDLVRATYVDFAANGWMFIAEQYGNIKLYRPPTADDPTGAVSVFADLTRDVNGVRDRGLLSIAVHPNFPEVPHIYAAYTYDPPEAIAKDPNDGSFAGVDEYGNRPSRVVKLTADPATGFTTALPGSGEVILGTNSTWANTVRPDKDSTADKSLPPSGQNPDGTWVRDYLATDSQSHSIGGMRFGLDGYLYVTNGDGASYGGVDPRADRVQDLDNLSGKLIRIDPITGDAPSDNPFYNGDPQANRSKVYAYGLRNPFRFAIHPTTGHAYIGDVGWYTYEEINLADGAGQNFGWPWYEGGEGANSKTPGYRDLPAAQTFYQSNNAKPPLLARDHQNEGARAFLAGDFYDGTGNVYPDSYIGSLFWADYGRGETEVINFNPDGTVRSNEKITRDLGSPVMMNRGPDGYVYIVNLRGEVLKLTFG